MKKITALFLALSLAFLFASSNALVLQVRMIPQGAGAGSNCLGTWILTPEGSTGQYTFANSPLMSCNNYSFTILPSSSQYYQDSNGVVVANITRIAMV